MKCIYTRVTNTGITREQGRNKRRLITDTGATGQFMMQGAPVINVTPMTNLIQITLPDGQRLPLHKCAISTSHDCQKDRNI